LLGPNGTRQRRQAKAALKDEAAGAGGRRRVVCGLRSERVARRWRVQLLAAAQITSLWLVHTGPFWQPAVGIQRERGSVSFPWRQFWSRSSQETVMVTKRRVAARRPATRVLHPISCCNVAAAPHIKKTAALPMGGDPSSHSVKRNHLMQIPVRLRAWALKGGDRLILRGYRPIFPRAYEQPPMNLTRTSRSSARREVDLLQECT
jgi:hypothetical protein